MVDNTLADDLNTPNTEFALIGNTVAPRQAAYAIYEGRKAALTNLKAVLIGRHQSSELWAYSC